MSNRNHRKPPTRPLELADAERVLRAETREELDDALRDAGGIPTPSTPQPRRRRIAKRPHRS